MEKSAKIYIAGHRGMVGSAIERKLNQEQEALEYEFRIEKATQEAERQRIDAEGKQQLTVS